MKYGQVETEKLYFSSAEAAELVGAPVSALHSWEKQFPRLAPNKNGAGKRVYRLGDIEIAKQIKLELEQSAETLFGEQAIEAKEKEANEAKPKARTQKIKASSGSSKASLLKIRDSLQTALDKIKR